MNVTEKKLMRDTVVVSFASGESGEHNTAYNLDIPEGYAMELHDLDIVIKYAGKPSPNFPSAEVLLLDDPDETVNPGQDAEKVITGTYFTCGYILTTTGAAMLAYFYRDTLDCHKTLIVKMPNLLVHLAADPEATFAIYGRLWFDFIKVRDADLLRLLRQQQY